MTVNRPRSVPFRITALCLSLLMLSGTGVAAQESRSGWPYEFQSKERVDLDLKAAGAGDGRAMADLCWRYVVRLTSPWVEHPNTQGTGVKQDNAEAIRWCRKGAAVGNGRAMAHLGWMYLTGRGVKQDYVEAARWFQKGAEAGDGRAMGSLGVMYLNGLGVQQNDADAARWFRRGAEAKYSRFPKIAEGLLPPGPRYIDPIGDARSMGNLGLMYLAGRGVKQDDAEGVRWLRLASEAGDKHALYHFTVIQATGAAGVPKKTDIPNLSHSFTMVEFGARGDEWSAGEMTFGDGTSPRIRRAAKEYSAKLLGPTISSWTSGQVLVGLTVLYVLLASLGAGGGSRSGPNPPNADPVPNLLDLCVTPVGFMC